MSWLAPLAAALCFLIYASGVVPPGLNDLVLKAARIVQGPGTPESRDGPRERGPYLRLAVFSGQNVTAMAENSELNTYPMIVDCANRDLSFFAYGPYQRGVHTSYLGLDRDHPRREHNRRAQEGGYEYELFLPVSGRLYSEADRNRPMPQYDLATESRTLCIRVGGGNMAGGHFRSNEVRLTVPLQ
jgi:hypothetical protein